MRVLFLLLAISVGAHSQESNEDAGELAGLFVLSKFVGGCGIIRQMVIFQESTQMPGGNEFIARFMNTEAARLGHTIEEYSQQCVDTTETYMGLMEQLDNQ